MNLKDKKSASLRDVFSKSLPMRYRKGEVILRADTIPSGVYFIEKGFVKVYSITQDGDEKLHIIYKEGELFPLIWLFLDLSKEVFYEALSGVVLRRLARKDFFKLTWQNSNILHEIIERIIVTLSVHVDRIDNLELSHAYSRVIARLIFLAKRFGVRHGKELIIQAPLTQKDIAASINMTRETVARELRNLELRKLIKYTDHLIAIPNMNKLKSELDIHYARKPL